MASDREEHLSAQLEHMKQLVQQLLPSTAAWHSLPDESWSLQIADAPRLALVVPCHDEQLRYHCAQLGVEPTDLSDAMRRVEHALGLNLTLGPKSQLGALPQMQIWAADQRPTQYELRVAASQMLLDLGRRAAACRLWQWLPGMEIWSNPSQLRSERILFVDGDRVVTDEDLDPALKTGAAWRKRPADWVPNFADVLTRMSALAVVRAAWQAPHLAIVPHGPGLFALATPGHDITRASWIELDRLAVQRRIWNCELTACIELLECAAAWSQPVHWAALAVEPTRGDHGQG